MIGMKILQFMKHVKIFFDGMRLFVMPTVQLAPLLFLKVTFIYGTGDAQ